MTHSKYGGDFVDWNNEWQYPLQWIYESHMARDEYRALLHRAEMAVLGKPSRNLYQEELNGNLEKVKDESVRKACEKLCTKVPEGMSFELRRAVQNRANQMAGGVDYYECQINDPYMVMDAETEDLLAAKCEQDYILNGMSRLAEVFSDDLTVAGMTAVLVKYDPITDRNKVMRINPKNVGWDTRYSSTGVERFRYYQTMISWAKLKKMISDDNDEVNCTIKAPNNSIFEEDGKLNEKAKVYNKKIRTLNGLDIYVHDMNKLATSTQLQGNWGQHRNEYQHDLKRCYNLSWYHTFASDPKARTDSGYNGDDVELTVLYDLNRKIEFKIINRRYVISKNERAFRRKIAFPITNPITGETKTRIDDYCLDCPLKIQFAKPNLRDTAPYPMSPIFPLLDLHDELCAWRAKRDHVSKILSILRISTNSADAASLQGILNIMGIVIDDIQGDITSIGFSYDYTPIDTEITYRETTIQEVLHAYTDFDSMQAMGDRASAAESGMAQHAIASGLTTLQNAIMDLYASIARQCIGNRVVYSPNQEFPVSTYGEYSSLTIQQMALNAVITAKSKIAKQTQQRTIAANAITLLGTLGDSVSEAGKAYLLQQAMMGSIPRKLAQNFIIEKQVNDQEMALAQLEAQNMANQLAQNQQNYQQDPLAYEVENVMQTQTPEAIDQIIQGLNAPQDTGYLTDIINAANQAQGLAAMNPNDPTNPDPAMQEQAAEIVANEQASGMASMSEEDLATLQQMASMSGVTPEQMYSMMGGTTSGTQATQANQATAANPQVIDMEGQAGAMATNLAGLTSDSGSALANPNSLV